MRFSERPEEIVPEGRLMLCLCFATLLTTFSLPLCHSKVIDNFFTATLPLKSYPVLCFLCLNSSLVCRTNTGAHSSRAAATHSTLPPIDPVDRENLKRRTHRVPLRVSPGGGVSLRTRVRRRRFPYSSGRRNQWVAAPGLRTLPS